MLDVLSRIKGDATMHALGFGNTKCILSDRYKGESIEEEG